MVVLFESRETMNLGDILFTETIVPSLKAKDRWQAIEELVDTLILSKHVQAQNRDAVLAVLKKREQTMSTGIGFGVGIPHATTEHVSEVIGAFGRSAAGIDFAALDNQPVHLVVLFLVPQGQFQMHLHTLANIAKFLHDKKFRDQLSLARDAQEILSIMKNQGAK